MRDLNDPYLYSFVPRSIRIWSILPVNIACAPSIETFKGALYRIWCGVNRLGDSGVKVV